MSDQQEYIEPAMAKKYKHQEVEPRIYAEWEKSGCFKAKVDPDKKPYTIILPPPNSNGKLHVGHALMVAIEDLLIRWKRMQGYSTLWLPGTDHAGFETQVVYERTLEKKGKSRMDYDRETLYSNIWDFVKEQGDVILDQIRALGPSMDWSRYKFTLDEDVIDTVYKTFEKMASEDLIYRDDYIVNYCTRHNTTLSDLELEHKDKKSNMYYIKYRVVDPIDKDPKEVIVATTRPETIFADTHLAINPKDHRNKWLLGRKLLNPLTDVEMEIIEDRFVDPEFGTGIVKLTPAHDKNDFAASITHNLPIVPAFGTDGIINENGGELAGMYTTKARKRAAEIITDKGLMDHVDENYENSVAVCYKCGTVIEPIVLPNWFVKVESLKQPAHDVVKNGEVKIYPEWQEVKYHRWMEEMRDWPISRQIVWGIRIPVWYAVDKNPNIRVTFISKNGEAVSGLISEVIPKYSLEEISEGLQMLIAPKDVEYVISKEKPEGSYIQETDTFDTWFSSGQWPLVTLGYPDSEDYKYFYPTAVLETGWEILRFWVSRMIMFGIYLTGEVPFKDVYLHGLVRAEDGRKMSKSMGNQVDPLDMVEEYGADALRMGLISGTLNGKDFSFPKDKVISYRNFANKIWNMTRFMNIMFEKYEEKVPLFEDLTEELQLEDKEIIEGLSRLIDSVNDSLEKYRFGDAGDAIYHFMWDELASKYIELVKDREDKKVALCVLRHVFSNSIKLLHPFMPFVTEEIWKYIPGFSNGTLAIAPWPKS